MTFLSIAKIFSALVLCILITALPVQSRQDFRTSWVQKDDVPYYASVYLFGEFLCGATIVGYQYVMTPAHCVKGLTPPYYVDMKVITSKTNIHAKGETHYVKAIHTHPDYEPSPDGHHVNDVAIIKLTKLIQMSKTQRLIAIAKEDPPVDAKAMVTGWGVYFNKDTHMMRKAVSTVIPKNVCEQKLQSPLPPNQVCTYDKTEQDICIVDSGSPLVYDNKLVGMLTYVGACGTDSPLVYVKTAPYRVFVTNAINIR